MLGRRQNFSISESLKNDTINIDDKTKLADQQRDNSLRDATLEHLIVLKGYGSDMYSLQASAALYLVNETWFNAETLMRDELGQQQS